MKCILNFETWSLPHRELSLQSLEKRQSLMLFRKIIAVRCHKNMEQINKIFGKIQIFLVAKLMLQLMLIFKQVGKKLMQQIWRIGNEMCS
jgi:hypothetical protein